MNDKELFNKINSIKQQINNNRDERNTHYLEIEIQNLDNEYFNLTVILLDLLKQIDNSCAYKF